MTEDDPTDIQLLKIEIRSLNNKIDVLTNSLNTHINFVENIFKYVKKPLFFMVEKINNIFLLNDK
jgi:hypothetical protein